MWWWKSFLVLVLVVLTFSEISKSLAGDRVIYVTPEAHSNNCPKGEKCRTLQDCINNDTACFTNNTKMVLLDGTHRIAMMYPNDFPGTHQWLHHFTMTGNGSLLLENQDYPPNPKAIVLCSGPGGGFQFKTSHKLTFENLAFEHCGIQVAENLAHIHATLAFFVVTDLVIQSVRISNSTGYGIHADKVYGRVNILNSIFSHNKGSKKIYGGNAHFWYRECQHNRSNTSIMIKNSWFLYGSDLSSDYEKTPNATGLEVMVDCSFIYVMIENITAEGNTASKGGNLAMAFVDRHNKTAKIHIHGSRIAHGHALRGGGLTVWSEIAPSNESISCRHEHDIEKRTILEVSNTEFYNNFATFGGGALYLSHYERGTVDCIIRKIKFFKCKFNSNSVDHQHGSGAAAEITKYEMLGDVPHPEPQFEVSFKGSSFKNHYFAKLKPSSDIPQHGIVNALSVGKLVVHDTDFVDNNSTAISLLSSNLVLRGRVLFQNNTGYNGGALEFCTSSVAILENSTRTHILFINNSALKTGGAIYVEEPCLDTVPACFFQPELNLTSKPFEYECQSLNLLMKLTFTDNIAGEAGDVIYNGAIDRCYMQYNHRVRSASHNMTYETWSSCIFNHTFDVSQQMALKRPSCISSEPQRVCLCPQYHTKDCSILNFTYHPVFPGEMFNISVVAVGQREGIVPAVVEAYLFGKDSDHNKLNGATVGKTGNYCTNMTLAVGSNRSSVFFNLAVQPQRWKYENFPQVEVPIVKCPQGFSLDNDSNICTCDQNLSAKWKLLCNDESFKYKRLEPVWIGATEDEYLFSLCEYNYCNLDILNHEDDLMVNDYKQCSFNRTGHICGACMPNHSVVLGSSRCLQCNNNHLVPLLVAFASAGVALFAFLFIFNFTVTEGTINGLLFYANIVHINPDAFIRGNLVLPSSVLIAWLNLDLGIETCFFQGLDSYMKLWLQFGFIAYLWTIGGLIVFLSHKYIIVTRFFGRNVTKVLATLFLLSFTKVAFNVTKSTHFTIIRNSSLKIWHIVCDFDGNITYFSLKHIPLFILACLVIIVLTFFTITLMLIQCLQKGSTFRPLQWVERFRPFFEAFTGPCKINYRFWPGLLFMCRACLVVTSLLYQNPQDSLIRVTVITAVSMFLLFLSCVSPKGVYKKWSLNVLECSFFLNLTITSIALLVLESFERKVVPFSARGSSHQIIITVSISIVIVTFIGILTYHTCVQLTTSRLIRSCMRCTWWRLRKKTQPAPSPEPQPPLPEAVSRRQAGSGPPTMSIVTVEESEDEATYLLSQYMPPVTGFNTYREPLLADD